MNYKITITKHKGRYQIHKNGVLIWDMNPTEYGKLKDALIAKEFERRTKDEI